MKSGGLKVLGIIATVAGAALTIVNGYVDDKKMDEKIDKKLDERAKQNKEIEEA